MPRAAPTTDRRRPLQHHAHPQRRALQQAGPVVGEDGEHGSERQTEAVRVGAVIHARGIPAGDEASAMASAEAAAARADEREPGSGGCARAAAGARQAATAGRTAPPRRATRGCGTARATCRRSSCGRPAMASQLLPKVTAPSTCPPSPTSTSPPMSQAALQQTRSSMPSAGSRRRARRAPESPSRMRPWPRLLPQQQRRDEESAERRRRRRRRGSRRATNPGLRWNSRTTHDGDRRAARRARRSGTPRRRAALLARGRGRRARFVMRLVYRCSRRGAAVNFTGGAPLDFGAWTCRQRASDSISPTTAPRFADGPGSPACAPCRAQLEAALATLFAPARSGADAHGRRAHGCRRARDRTGRPPRSHPTPSSRTASTPPRAAQALAALGARRINGDRRVG